MDHFYDGQIRRYVTQFMRVFIGFKYKAGDGEYKHAPVLYGDLSRQAANIIKEHSENKLLTVPRISCYISSLELDTSRLADATFVSKINIRERAYDVVDGQREYKNYQGGNYTVERLMPTPFKLGLKADIWTSNTDQKLQFLEQILVLFNPSLDLQTTDNYVDWTSLTTLDLTSVSFSSRTIPQGPESEIDICSLDFMSPIWISPPAKVKKLGIVKNIIMNVFTEYGDIIDLNDLVFNGDDPNANTRISPDNFGVLLIKNPNTNNYECSVLSNYEAVENLGLNVPVKLGNRIDWNTVLDLHGGYTGTSRITFLQPNGYEISGTFTINELDNTFLVVDLDIDTLPTNTESAITAIINPYTFNPISKFNGIGNIPTGIRYLMLDTVNNSANRTGTIDNFGSPVPYDGADGWKNLDGSDPLIEANSIIEWDGSEWVTSFDPDAVDDVRYVTNLTTGIQYKFDQGSWLKSFEGEYAAGYWRLILDA